MRADEPRDAGARRMPADTPPVKVLYIAGYERSGSTLLTKVLGELRGVFAAGELRGIWHTSFANDQLCGCGEPFRECDVWQRIVTRAYGSVDAVDYRWMIAHRPRRRDTAVMLLPGGHHLVRRRFSRYIATLDRLYAAIAEETGSRLIVDSSKTPIYGYALALAPSVELYVLHLIRDPRGTQCSNLRRARAGHPQLQNYSVTRSSLLWNMLHLTQEAFARGPQQRYLRLRYEDFIADPLGAVQRIGAFVGDSELGLPTIEDERILLSVNHIMSGNRNRAEVGSVPLRLDDRWRTELDPKIRRRITRLTFPLLRHYSYAR